MLYVDPMGLPTDLLVALHFTVDIACPEKGHFYQINLKTKPRQNKKNNKKKKKNNKSDPHAGL